MGEITRLLEQVSDGDCNAEERLLTLVHDELKRLAAARLSTERPGHTLQTTALVNEAYLRLLAQSPANKDKNGDSLPQDSVESTDGSGLSWHSRAHFFSAAAEAMRRVLIDSARSRNRKKRGGKNQQVPLMDVEFQIDSSNVDLEALDAALTKLESQNKDHASIVKLRFFAGMTIEQTAEALGISPATVKRSWTYSRAWLRREIVD